MYVGDVSVSTGSRTMGATVQVDPLPAHWPFVIITDVKTRTG